MNKGRGKEKKKRWMSLEEKDGGGGVK